MITLAKLRLTDNQLNLLGRAAAAERMLVSPSAFRERRTCASLCARGLLQRISEDAHTYQLTDEGWAGLGLKAPAELPSPAAIAGSADAKPINEEQQAAGVPRQGSKLSLVVELLLRAEGGSISQIRERTGWLPHTCRAALTGLKKRGYQIDKNNARPAQYRITGHVAAAGDLQ